MPVSAGEAGGLPCLCRPSGLLEVVETAVPSLVEGGGDGPRRSRFRCPVAAAARRRLAGIRSSHTPPSWWRSAPMPAKSAWRSSVQESVSFRRLRHFDGDGFGGGLHQGCFDSCERSGCFESGLCLCSCDACRR